MKVLFAGLALFSAWLITETIKNRYKVAYLRNQVAKVKIILTKLQENVKNKEVREREDQTGQA